MKMMLRRLSHGLLVLVLGLAATAGLASDTKPDRRTTFEERLDLLQVELDVVVTDSKGRPVTDLGREDLELYRDGAKQEILFFGAPTLDPGHVVIYVDNLRLLPKRRNFLLRRLGSFLDRRLERGDRISLVVFDRSLEFLTTYSKDSEKIRMALTEIETRSSRAVQLAVEARRLRLALNQGVGESALESQIEGHVRRLRVDVGRSVAALRELVQALAGAPGATSVLYLSDGLPDWPGEGFRSALPRLNEPLLGIQTTLEPSGFEDDPAVSARPIRSVQFLVSSPRTQSWPWQMATAERTVEFLEPLIQAANTHGIRFFPIRPSGAESLLIGDSLSALTTYTDTLKPLRQLAESTGGDLVSYGRFEVALEQLSERLDASYTVGFQTSPGSDQAAQALEVRLARKGLRAHYRRAYAAMSADSRLAAGTLSALLLGIDANPLALALEVSGEVSENGVRVVPVHVKIPVNQLLLDDAVGRLRGHLSLCWAVRDDQGRRSDVGHVRLPLEIPAQRPLEGNADILTHVTKLRLSPGSHVVALGLRDDRANVSSFVHAKISGD